MAVACVPRNQFSLVGEEMGGEGSSGHGSV